MSHIYTNVMPPDILPWKSNALPWHLEYIFQAMFYMVLGYVFKRKLEMRYDELRNRKLIMLLFMMYLVVVYAPHCLAFQLSGVVSIAHVYLCEIMGCSFIVGISKKIKSNCFVRSIGGNTLIVFALHGKVYSLIQTILKSFMPIVYSAILNSAILSSVVASFLAVIIMTILLVPIYVINRWLPFVVGRENKDRIDTIS